MDESKTCERRPKRSSLQFGTGWALGITLLAYATGFLKTSSVSEYHSQSVLNCQYVIWATIATGVAVTGLIVVVNRFRIGLLLLIELIVVCGMITNTYVHYADALSEKQKRKEEVDEIFMNRLERLTLEKRNRQVNQEPFMEGVIDVH